MRPTLAAEALRRNITQYLATTFDLVDPAVRDALAAFVNHPEHGIFRGPYLRVRLPFRVAADGWQRSLEWYPAGFPAPYEHQARAFARLSTQDGPAQPTLVTTGTGSGKTESFLLPILDHCRRERAKGRAGVKAVLLYPMNALATDQTQRINRLLQDPALRDVTAGLYIGDVAAVTYQRVLTKRSEIRTARPDLLITNYKMLDLLLQRGDDQPLWQGAELAYVVLDEFHTYDGAQGTDVAMLLRRLGAATGAATADRPLGNVCPVATSATLGSGSAGASTALLEVAGQVFGRPFDADAIVGEVRYGIDEFIPELDYSLPLPEPAQLAAIADPAHDGAAMAQIAEAVLGRPDLDPVVLGQGLRQHTLTKAVIDILDGRPKTAPEILEWMPRKQAYSWGAALRNRPDEAATALSRFVALLSLARNPDAPGRPLVNIESHLWVRSVARLLRTVSRQPAFAWAGEPLRHASPDDPESDLVVASDGQPLLPSVYCRHCGRSGWAALSPEKHPEQLVDDPDRIYRASVGNDKRRVRTFIPASDAEIADRRLKLHTLDPLARYVAPYDREKGAGGAIPVLMNGLDDEQAARTDTCPACGSEQGIRFLGLGLASLASVAVTQLFTGGELAKDERKTLLFNDSVQDAAHRAGFIATRSYTFSLRALLASQLRPGTPVRLHDLIAAVIAAAAQDREALAAVVPPDLHDRAGVDALLAGEDGGTRETWALIAERLAFSTVLEFGLRARPGRTLEATRSAAVEASIDDPAAAVRLGLDAFRQAGISAPTEPGPAQVEVFLRGLLERLRTRGAIAHTWLRPYISSGGRRYLVWGGRPDGMPAFPRGLAAPRFLATAAPSRSEFDVASGRDTWYADWTSRALGITRDEATGYLGKLLPALATAGIVASRPADTGATVFGLRAGHISITLLDDDQATRAGVQCGSCGAQLVVHPDRVAVWDGAPCTRYRCTGILRPHADETARDDYYRRLYRDGRVFRVVTAEHTGLLSRAQRERVEEGFRRGTRYTDPNVLTSTPTLEMGIDIGGLSAVLLASLPKGPANYVQRAGRAGRATGNALVVTLIGGRERERYFLAEPRTMIDGQILPPGCYLSAVELLRRQYVAHLLDLAARGRLGSTLPLPRRASALFGYSGWLTELATAGTGDGGRLVEEFLALFGTTVSPTAAADLREFALDGLMRKVKDIQAAWDDRLAELRHRLDEIDAAIPVVATTDPQVQRESRSLKAEARAVRRRIAEIGRAPAHATLVEFGLLPNYALIDNRTDLEATLTWQDRSPGSDDAQYHSEVREYDRPARQALRELAPGNAYYVRGYQHRVTALHIGPAGRRLWQDWRVCPACGFVRQPPDSDSTAACDRCQEPHIADAGNVYRVLVPTRVIARNRRDDARIDDDSDDRDSRVYSIATAIDIDPSRVEGSWKHGTVTFGADFTRHAVVRTFNLGAARYDRAPDHAFAGEDVRLNPFLVCEDCGGATADPLPTTPAALPGLTPAPSAAARDDHHLPWCPSRRGGAARHQELVLAHELRTEALRILVPAVTALVKERRISFAAAVRLGLAARYGGEPDHLRIEYASMPARDGDPTDGSTKDAKRTFVIVYDMQPSGTGYLQRLTDPKEMRGVLEAARAVIEGCACGGEDPRGCHRCLLRYARDSEFALTSRAEALSMLDDLLRDWSLAASDRRMDEISLIDQIESELEARFLRALEERGRTPGSGFTFTRETVGGPVRVGELRFAPVRPGEPGTRWRMRLQNTIHGTRPDVQFIRLDGERIEVAVYLDGYQYHAAPTIPGRSGNRIADDADKRTTLRAHGYRVFQVTWDDVERWRGATVSRAPVWPPYGGLVQEKVRDIYRQRSSRDAAELATTLWAQPLDQLFAYLADPDSRVWRWRAEAALGGLLALQGRTIARYDSTALPAAVAAAIRGDALPQPTSGGITLVRAVDGSGCPVVTLVDQRGQTPRWAGFVVCDDRIGTIRADQDAHRLRWAAWLAWSNLIQFLADDLGGDAAQLAYSTVDSFDPAALEAAESTGVLFAHRLKPIDEESAAWLGRKADADAVPAPLTKAQPADERWRRVLALVSTEESGLESLVHDLAARGAPVPTVGYELGDDGWQAELAWPEAHVAVVLGQHHRLPEAQIDDRDQAFAAAGWRARTPREWNLDELLLHIGKA